MALPKVNVSKHTVVIVGSSLLVLVALVGLLALYQHQHNVNVAHAKAQAAATAQAEEARANVITNLKAELKQVQDANTANSQSKQLLCSYTRPSILARTVRAQANCQ